MKVLVTGGAGFIGSHLVEKLLADGHIVSVLDNSVDNIDRNLSAIDETNHNLFIHLGDINKLKTNGKYFSEGGRNESIGEDFDWVVHLAAIADIVPSIECPYKYHRTNVDGTVKVLEFARVNKIKKFIYAASGSCYGDKPPLPTKETDPINCKYPYALTKWIGECYAMHWNRLYNLPVISLRFFNVFGPRSRTTGAYGAVFGVFLAQKLNRKPYTVIGSGAQSRDFIYVSDVVDGIILALNSERSGEIYNIGSGSHSTINNLVNLLGREHGVENLPDRPGEPHITLAWIAKAQEHLRFTTKVDFAKGVKIMLQNIEYWSQAPVWDKSKIKEVTAKWFEVMK